MFTGTVTLRRSLPLSPPDQYQLIISAVDGLNSPALVDANVTIMVLRESALAPLFTESLYQFNITENAAEDTIVGTVRAEVQGWVFVHEIAYCSDSDVQFSYGQSKPSLEFFSLNI